MTHDYNYFTRLNSATKYPSILNYHKLGERGRVTSEVQVPFEDDDEIIVTEKLDGVNSRIIYLRDSGLLGCDVDYLLGSREELLYARGDRLWHVQEGIVDTLKSIAERAKLKGLVIFGEVFGGITRLSKEYSGSGQQGFRIFDVQNLDNTEELLRNPDLGLEDIARWRDQGRQSFGTESTLESFSKMLGVKVTPRIKVIKGRDLPVGIQDTYDWLKSLTPKTRCLLDPEGKGSAEGVVIRTADRRKIAKVRVQEYAKTLR